MDAVKLHGKLIDNELFTQDELRLITNILGFSVETFNRCIYARYGFWNWEQLEKRIKKLEEKLKKIKGEII